jgi:hypothetical protein
MLSFLLLLQMVFTNLSFEVQKSKQNSELVDAETDSNPESSEKEVEKKSEAQDWITHLTCKLNFSFCFSNIYMQTTVRDNFNSSLFNIMPYNPPENLV